MRLRDAEKLCVDDKVTLKKSAARDCHVTNLSAVVLRKWHCVSYMHLDVLLNGGTRPLATLRHDEVLLQAVQGGK